MKKPQHSIAKGSHKPQTEFPTFSLIYLTDLHTDHKTKVDTAFACVPEKYQRQDPHKQKCLDQGNKAPQTIVVLKSPKQSSRSLTMRSSFLISPCALQGKESQGWQPRDCRTFAPTTLRTLLNKVHHRHKGEEQRSQRMMWGEGFSPPYKV